ncbi:MAG: hypothetical protein Q4P25_01925 [Tissierellia bacterium]|nr:hypothetical protein [Tissierellia bacterium]
MIEKHRTPSEIKDHYQLKDVVRFIRYYLEDYPVFTYIVDNKILVLVIPLAVTTSWPLIISMPISSSIR